MTRDLMMGIDIGTTSTKAVLFDRSGRAVAGHGVEYPLDTPQAGAAEQDPDRILLALLEAVRTTVKAGGGEPRRIRAIGMSCAMHSLLLVDGNGKPLTPSFTWADNRAAPWARRIAKEGGEAIYRRTGTPIHPMSPLCKLPWLKETRGELFERAARFVSVKEYVTFRLFGQWWVDHSIASATGLFNLESRDWDAEALKVAGLTPERLSKLVPTTHVMEGIDATLCAEMGLDPATPWVIGANDGVLSNLGVDAIAPGAVAVTVGTSGAIRTVVDKPRTDPQGRTFCYVLTDRHWVIGGPINNGGVVLRWARDQLSASETETARRLGVDPYELLTRIAARVPAGAEGLLFHPYLAGERAPLWNADARGSFFGLTLRHGREHLIRAVMEGVIFSLCSVFRALEDLMEAEGPVKATGGFARSELWRQMLADAFQREVVVPESVESSCLGAAVLALYALGEVDDLTAIAGMVGQGHHHHPDPATARVYARLLPLFMQLPTRLEADYAAIAAFQRGEDGEWSP